MWFSQIPGMDFNENYAQVFNDVILRVMLMVKLILGQHSTMIDVKTTFLH
jgi:hypothetical protein